MGWLYTLLIVGSDLYHCGGQIGAGAGGTVAFAQASVTAVNVGSAFFAAEYGPLGEYGQAVKGGGAAAAYHGVGQNAVVEGHIDAVVIPVEGHRLHINVGVEQFGAADFCAGGTVQQALGCLR